MARERTYAPSNYSSSTAKSFSGKTNTAQNNNKDTYRTTTQYKSTPVSGPTYAARKAAVETANAAAAFNNLKFTKKFTPSILGMTLNVTGLAEKGFEANKAYYEKNVIGKNNFTKSPDNFKSYMSKRGSGEIDAMGRAISGGGNGGNTQPGITKNIGGSTIQTTAPTTAEVSQSEAANADAAALKVKKRGRSQSIMTSAKGVTKTSTGYSLGTPSLLGRV
jgi:hypothetical protein